MKELNRKRAKAWDNAAKKDAMVYITSVKSSWTEKDFFDTGAEEAHKFAGEFLSRVGFNPAGKRMLDFGCGIGRMTRAFSEMFSEAYGVDFSEETIRKAGELNKHKPNLFFASNNGADLAIYEDEFFDFCFSYAMFQHIPDLDIIRSYVNEIARVLKPGGLFRLHFDCRKWGPEKLPIIHRSLFNLFLKTGLVDRFAAFYFRNRYRDDDEYSRKAYPGIWLSSGRLVRMLEQAGLEIIEISGKDTSWSWYSGKKNPVS
ncbi:MAG TPA: class I SAM-dependent methyltransferase [Dehalococcoidia bacterium]|nr:class I SAM-dependent methyltransferase [Dehalococcoidia bacterium]